jgi:hypothetical protein
MTRLQAIVLWVLVVAVTIGLAGGAKLYVEANDARTSNCEAINETRMPLTVILERSRQLTRDHGDLDRPARNFYRDSIASLAPLNCG